ERDDGDQHGRLHQYHYADLDGQRRLRQQHQPGASHHGDRHDGAGGDGQSRPRRDDRMSDGAQLQRADVRGRLPGQRERERDDGDQHGRLHQYHYADLDGQRRLRQQHQPGASHHGDRHDGAGGDGQSRPRRDDRMSDGAQLQRADVRGRLPGQREPERDDGDQHGRLHQYHYADLDGQRRLRQQHQPDASHHGDRHDGAGGDGQSRPRRDDRMSDGAQLQRADVRGRLPGQRERERDDGDQHGRLHQYHYADLDGQRRLRQQHHPGASHLGDRHDGAGGDGQSRPRRDDREADTSELQ